MSRHLQILPVLRSTAGKLRKPAEGKENVEINTETKRSKRKLEKSVKKKEVENCGQNYLNLVIDEKESRLGFEIGNSCETPKSDEYKIPKGLDCPPAPKKPNRRIGCVSCKRKLMPELEFFEADRRKEIDEFFKSSFVRISEANAKRNCSIAIATATAASPVDELNESSSSSSSSPI